MSDKIAKRKQLIDHQEKIILLKQDQKMTQSQWETEHYLPAVESIPGNLRPLNNTKCPMIIRKTAEY